MQVSFSWILKYGGHLADLAFTPWSFCRGEVLVREMPGEIDRDLDLGMIPLLGTHPQYGKLHTGFCGLKFHVESYPEVDLRQLFPTSIHV